MPNKIQGKKVLVLLILTNIIYAIMLTVTIPTVMSFSGGMKLLDMKPLGYNPEYVNDLMANLGINGRHAYLYNQIPFDMVYPFLFGVSYCLLLGYLLNKMGKLTAPYFYLCFIPVLAGISDYMENAGIISILLKYPGNSNQLSEVTNLFSIMKSISTTAFFIILIVTLIFFAWERLIRRKEK